METVTEPQCQPDDEDFSVKWSFAVTQPGSNVRNGYSERMRVTGSPTPESKRHLAKMIATQVYSTICRDFGLGPDVVAQEWKWVGSKDE